MRIPVPDLEPWIISALQIFLSVIAGLLIHFILLRLVNQFAKLYFNLKDMAFLRKFNKPTRLLIILLSLRFTATLLQIPELFKKIFTHALDILLITSVAWLIIQITFAMEDFVVQFYESNVKDHLRIRGIVTQISFFKRLIVILVSIIAIAAVMMTFDKVRQLGTSIIASAGVIGVIVGLAAQKTIGTLLGGLQIAITQPIKFDDVVIVEGEWGVIEEITLTYVVVRIWDMKRMIVPITNFIEKPFQNLSRVASELLGTVFIYVDYTAPVQEIRNELMRIVKADKSWDGKICELNMTKTTENTIELRAVMSAASPDDLWTIRCNVREKLVEFVQKNYPEYLPVSREIQKNI